MYYHRYKLHGHGHSYLLKPMPAIRAPASRVMRHFSPLTTRTTFKQERLSTPPPIAYRIVYPVGTHTPKSTATNPFGCSKPKSKTSLKKKPDGEVTRLNRGGYNLQAELKWADELYQSCQVNYPTINLAYNITETSVQKTLSKIADTVLDVSKTWPEQTTTKKKEFLKAVSTASALAL